MIRCEGIADIGHVFSSTSCEGAVESSSGEESQQSNDGQKAHVIDDTQPYEVQQNRTSMYFVENTYGMIESIERFICKR